MVKVFKEFIKNYMKPSPAESGGLSEHSIRIATAALLLEMMRTDGNVNDEEQASVERIIKTKFGLAEEETEALLRIAEDKIWKATGYYEFTSLINKECVYDQKVKIIEHLWEVAFSDSKLDKYEEHMVRKISDLLYVSHSDFIKVKLKVRKDTHAG
jgi:uncharacterized tellurite resistance protein B-like protein